MAIVYRQRVDDDTEFALWKIEEQAEDLYNQLQLNESEKAFIEQKGNPEIVPQSRRQRSYHYSHPFVHHSKRLCKTGDRFGKREKAV